MLIDFHKPILEFNGEPRPWAYQKWDEKGNAVQSIQPMLALTACQEALGGGYEDERQLSQEIKNTRFLLGLRISGPSPVEITTEEAGEILRLVNKAFPGSLVYPRVSEIINAASKAAETKPEAKTGE